MPYVLAVLAVSVMGIVFGISYLKLDFAERQRQEEIKQLKKLIRADYENRFDEVDNSADGDFLGYVSLRDYCADRGLKCRDMTGEWRWQITVFDEGLYRYRQIEVFDGAERQLFRVSGLHLWAEYMYRIDKVVGQFCTALYNYQKLMSERASADLNWFARTEGGCFYDGGVNAVVVGGAVVQKQINCSDGWADAEAVGFDVVGGVFTLKTGKIEVKNDNSIYTGECASAGLSGNAPPYAVAVRLRIIDGRYFQVCCGY